MKVHRNGFISLTIPNRAPERSQLIVNLRYVACVEPLLDTLGRPSAGSRVTMTGDNDGWEVTEPAEVILQALEDYI